MKTILLTRHSATEHVESSLYNIFSRLEEVTELNYKTIKVDGNPWSIQEQKSWILENALSTDMAFTSIPDFIYEMRTNGWRGKTIFKAMGGFPRGATNIREVLPYLYSSDVIWCTCAADVEIYSRLVSQNGLQPEAICIPYSVNSEIYQPLKNRESREELRSAWGFKPNDFVLVYAGRVTVEKNVHSILEAVYELTRLGYPVKLLIVGRIENAPFGEFHMYPIDLDEKIDILIQSLQISDRVVIQEWQTPVELNAAFNAADAFINLTLHHDENFGLSQIEAMSAGLPVIGTAWGGLKDTIVNEEGGFAADTWLTSKGVRFDAPIVIDTIKRLIENSQMREEQGKRGRERAIANYSDTLYNERVTHLIETVLNRTTKGTMATFTPFGHRFHQRFTRKDLPLKYAKRMDAINPLYDGLADSDYLELIEPYTSRVGLELKPESLLFRALSGEQSGKFFISNDLLYPIRIPISLEEADAIRALNRWQVVQRKVLNHSNNILVELIQKGIVGISGVSK